MFFLLPRRSFPAVLASTGLLFCSSLLVTAAAQEAGSAPANPRIDEALHGLSRGRTVGQAAISPDGRNLAWIQYAQGGEEIRVAPLGDLDHSRRITAADSPGRHCREDEIAWEPDGAALAFFSDCARPEEQTDLYIASLNGSPARRLTALDGYVQAPAFAPDGKSIAFLYVAGATRPAGALAAMKPPSGVIGEDGVEVQRVALAAVNAAAPAPPAFATPAHLHVYEFDWSPDAKSLAYIAADPPGENNWWVATLYTQKLGAGPIVLLSPAAIAGALHGLQIAVPRWSPDGKAIAFIGGLMSDQGSTGGDLWIVAAAGGPPRNHTPQRPASPAWIEWDGSRNLFVSELAGGNSRLVLFNLNDNRSSARAASTVFSIPGTAGDGRMNLSLSATADRSLFVFRASSFDRPTEIYAARPAAPPSSSPDAGFAGLLQLTHFNTGVEPAWGRSISLDWSNEGFHVQGWLLLPKDYDPAKKYPLIVEVHGGPAAAVVARWGAGGGLSPAAFSALGYFVLQPNPRGSFGQGEAFTQANRKDFGYGDLRDILAGVDLVEAKYPVDANRVGITGWSYGGFMTMFAVTQTNRFKAAVAGAGISDWLSYYGENSIDQWMIPYFGASVYDDPAVYQKSSALSFIKSARTPALVVVGDRDGECPAPQSFEFWHALRDQHVPTQLVVYPDEGHGFANPAHRRDVTQRAIEWFARYMPPTP
jgi:dipeptidyl aminopeptidase/acylaminoacyl peptidase